MTIGHPFPLRILVPKVSLGTPLLAKLCFAVRTLQETELESPASPYRAALRRGQVRSQTEFGNEGEWKAKLSAK